MPKRAHKDGSRLIVKSHIKNDLLNRFRGCLLGLAVGDAVGTTVEFRSRGSFPPVTDMTGGGPFGLKPGEWTDDTSMALCLATSLVEMGRFDAGDQMRRYCQWMDTGFLSSNGRCFDIGATVSGALNRFKKSGDPFSGSRDAHSAGNGCLMRLAPIPMFFHTDRDLTIAMSAESARTTHGAVECVEASQLFGAMLYKALSGATREEILFAHGVGTTTSPKLKQIALGAYREKSENEIQGSGYVVESLEAALWCFLTTDSFRDAILKATNLGQDADTTAAICGQLAGAFYGETGIPNSWLNQVARGHEISILATQLAAGPLT